jgi:cytochrome b
MNIRQPSTFIKVWDLPTRIFHWSLALAVTALVISAEIGGEAMVWHFRLGYGVLSLLIFRLVWGFVGGKWSRFNSFNYPLKTVLRYARGERSPAQEIGHNPLGAWSVFAMLFFLSLQVSTGLFSDDEIANAGPLVKFASNGLVNYATFYHKAIGKLIIFALVGLHIAAIAHHYYVKKDNLIRPMIMGFKPAWFETLSSKDNVRSRLLAAVIFVLASGLVVLMTRLAG